MGVKSIDDMSRLGEDMDHVFKVHNGIGRNIG